jgi:hypothetical protein
LLGFVVRLPGVGVRNVTVHPALLIVGHLWNFWSRGWSWLHWQRQAPNSSSGDSVAT